MASMAIINIMALGISPCRANTVLSVISAENAFAFALSQFVAFDRENGFVQIPKGVLFVLLASGMYLILPNEDIRHRRVTALNEFLPRQDKP
jgi:hypothetical protein